MSDDLIAEIRQAALRMQLGNPEATVRFDWTDIGWTALATYREYAVAWKLVCITSWDLDGDGTPTMWGEGFAGESESPELAEPYAELCVKADGCSTMRMHDDGIHLCGTGDGRGFAEAIRRMYMLSAAMPKWDDESEPWSAPIVEAEGDWQKPVEVEK